MKRSRLRRTGKRRERALEEAQKWREEVLARAEDRCERCGSTYRLHAHHRKGRNRCTSEEMWDPENGSALCWLCHDEVHRHEGDWRAWID